MTPNTLNPSFSPLINGTVSNVRRIGHSITNVAKTTKQGVVNFLKKPTLGGVVDGGASVLNVGATAVRCERARGRTNMVDSYNRPVAALRCDPAAEVSAAFLFSRPGACRRHHSSCDKS